MDPSPMSPGAARHGRRGSTTKSNKRGRGYSAVDNRETMISKALSFVLKRAVAEEDEQEEGEEKLVANADGWVDCEDVVSAFSLHYTMPKFRY